MCLGIKSSEEDVDALIHTRAKIEQHHRGQGDTPFATSKTDAQNQMHNFVGNAA